MKVCGLPEQKAGWDQLNYGASRDTGVELPTHAGGEANGYWRPCQRVPKRGRWWEVAWKQIAEGRWASPEEDMTEGGAHQLATVLGPVEEEEAKVEEGTRADKKQGALVL